tara:strand:+ start:607 stop:831 length:225 start_codon:yes stop_codon:yes gene_type:complete
MAAVCIFFSPFLDFLRGVPFLVWVSSDAAGSAGSAGSDLGGGASKSRSDGDPARFMHVFHKFVFFFDGGFVNCG